MRPVFAPPFGPGSLSDPKLPRRALRLAFALGCLPVALPAHGDLHEQIQSVSRELAATPSAALYLRRGGLHHEHAEYAQALSDYERAERLDPTLEAIGLACGRTLFASGRLPEAKAALDRYLQRKPHHADAFLLRARILVGQKCYVDAVQDFDRNLQLTPQPLPECFLERAEALVFAGDKPAALRSLDEGLRRQGNLVTLQNAAIALELALGRPDAALQRVDRVLADLQRKESWLARRGEILETAGRRDEARRTFTEALAAIDRLPVHHRETQSMRDLQAQLRLKLGS